MTAPVAGTLGSDDGRPRWVPPVEKGQVVLTLLPIAPAERDVRIEAERAVREAEGRQEMAAKRAERAPRNWRAMVRAVKGPPKKRKPISSPPMPRSRRPEIDWPWRHRTVSASGAVPLAGPHAAVLRTLHATPGQTVSAGAPLFDLVALETVWLRVPLYAGDVETVDRRAPATVVPARRREWGAG